MPKPQRIPNDAEMRKAINEGARAKVLRILEAGYAVDQPFVTDMLFDREADGRNALLLAVHHRHIKIVQLLLDRGADVNARDRVDQTPLHYAAMDGTDEMCALLLAAGAEVNVGRRGGCSPLQLALDASSAVRSAMLVEAGASSSFVPPDCYPIFLTPLQRAVEAGDVKQADLLMNLCEIDLRQTSLNGRTLDELCDGNREMRRWLNTMRTQQAIESGFGAAFPDQAVGTRRNNTMAPL